MVYDHAGKTEQRLRNSREADRARKQQLCRDGVYPRDEDKAMGCSVVMGGSTTNDGMFMHP